MGLDPVRWARIEELYELARARPVDERAAFVRVQSGSDAALCDELLAMLAVEEDGSALGIERLVADDDEPRETVDPRIGTRLGAWRLDAVLGRGGSGMVYLAARADGQYEQRAALKLIAPGVLSPELLARFRVERRILARLVHPNIARLIDGGIAPDGTPYLVMEYVDGTSLTTYCNDRAVSTDERLRLFRVVCSAVEHAHRALVVHRDLKPSNIYVSSTGDVKLLDFGIAKLLEPDETGSDVLVTRTEHRLLTPAYAAPEQLRGDAVTTATDVYALGVVLYELLAGERPTFADGLVSASRLRGDLDRICRKALSPEPEQRYASVAQFADDIERFLIGRPVVARPPTIAYRARRFVSRNKVAVAASASFVLLVVTFAVVATVQARLVVAERDRATIERDKAREVVQVLIDLFQSTNPEVVPDGDRLTTGEFLTRAEPRVLVALESRPEIRSAMMHVLGQVHAARSDYARARSLLERAVSESLRLYGQGDAATQAMQIDLASLLLQIGERGAARTLLEATLDRGTQDVGDRRLLTARALTVLARTYPNTGAKTAKPLLERALAIRRGLLGPNDLQLADTLDELAVVEMSLERMTEARVLLDEARRIVNANNGGRNVRAVSVTLNLGTLAGKTGKFADAVTLFQRGAALAADLIGPDSLQVADALNDAAVWLSSLGKLAESADMFRESYARHVALMGETHWRSGNTARNIAATYVLLDRPVEARPWMERALRAQTAADGEDDAINTAYYRAQYASVLSALGEHAVALRMLEASVSRIEQLSAPDYYGRADVHMYFGHALMNAGRSADAEPHFRYTVTARRKLLSADHPQLAQAECFLAQALAGLGRTSEALGLLEACVPRIEHYGWVQPSVRAAAGALLTRLRTARPASR